MAKAAIEEFRQEMEQKLENFHKQKNATVNQVYENVTQAIGLGDFKFEQKVRYPSMHGIYAEGHCYSNRILEDKWYELEIVNARGHVRNYNLYLNSQLIIKKLFNLPSGASIPQPELRRELRDKISRSLALKPCTVSELVTEFTAITGLRFLFKRIDIYGKRSDGRLLEGIFFISESDGKNEPIQLSIMHAERWVLTWSITCSTGTIDTADMPHPVDFLHKGVQC